MCIELRRSQHLYSNIDFHRYIRKSRENSEADHLPIIQMNRIMSSGGNASTVSRVYVMSIILYKSYHVVFNTISSAMSFLWIME